MDHPLVTDHPKDQAVQLLVELSQIPSFRNAVDRFLVADVDGQVAGYCVGFPSSLIHKEDLAAIQAVLEDYGMADAYESEEEAFDGEWYLDSIVVDQAFRRRGIASQLLQAAEDQAKKDGESRLGLICDQDNPKARSLYEKQGFEKIAEQTILGHRYDHMQKELSE